MHYALHELGSVTSQGHVDLAKSISLTSIAGHLREQDDARGRSPEYRKAARVYFESLLPLLHGKLNL